MARFKQMKAPKVQKETGQIQGGRVSSRLEVKSCRYLKSVYSDEVHCLATMQTFKWWLGAEVPGATYLVLFRVAGGVINGPFEANIIELKNYCPRIYEKTASIEHIHAVKSGCWVEIFDYHEEKKPDPAPVVKKRAGLFA